MNKLLDTILEQTYTQADLHRRLRILKDFLTQKIFSSQDIAPPNTSQADLNWLSSLSENFIKAFDKNNVYQKVQELEVEAKKVVTLTIYTPFELPEAALAELAERVRNNFSKNLLLDIKADPNLVAGCALVWNGIYKDYSLRKRIEDNRQTIIEAFKRSLK